MIVADARVVQAFENSSDARLKAVCKIVVCEGDVVKGVMPVDDILHDVDYHDKPNRALQFGLPKNIGPFQFDHFKVIFCSLDFSDMRHNFGFYDPQDTWICNYIYHKKD